MHRRYYGAKEEVVCSWGGEGRIHCVRKARVTASKMRRHSTRSRARKWPLVRERRMHNSTENK